MDLDHAKGIISDFFEFELGKKIKEFGKSYFYEPAGCVLQDVEEAHLLLQELL